jgi:hypothetical protein
MTASAQVEPKKSFDISSLDAFNPKKKESSQPDKLQQKTPFFDNDRLTQIRNFTIERLKVEEKKFD